MRGIGNSEDLLCLERSGVRGWRHAWANGGVPAFVALLAGAAVVPLRDLLVLAYAGAVATAAADTCSFEVGKAYARRTIVLWAMWATMNFSYYGIFLWLPSPFVRKGHSLEQTLLFNLLISLAQVPGYVAAARSSSDWGAA